MTSARALYICSCGNTLTPAEVGELKMGSRRPVLLLPGCVLCDCGLHMRLFTEAERGGKVAIDRAHRRLQS